jgi:hypothetical protein
MPPRLLTALGVALVLALAAAASGCLGGSAPPDFYALRSGSGDATGAPLAQLPELGLAIGPLELPRHLDRPELVAEDGSQRLVVADAHRWGGSLRSDVLRVVADDLGRLLGTARVAVYPSEPRFQAQYRVLLDVRELASRRGERVTLLARWTIAAVPDGRALAVEQSQIEQPVAGDGWGDLVAAQSAAFGTLSRRIAERVVALAGE